MIIENFSRYEFKYIVNNKLANEIEREASYFTKKDKFITAKKNFYYVNSIYFDNIEFDNFYEKTDGIKKRKKYRIRTYSSKFDFKSPIFLELKGKNNNRTYKERTEISNTNELKHILFSNNLFINRNNNLNSENFFFEKIRKNLHPNLFVNYKRRPFHQINGLNFRITFDYDLKASKFINFFSNDYSEIIFDCLKGYSIIEIKFERAIPTWFHRIVQCYNLERISVSKYVVGIKTSKLALDRS